MALAGWDLRVPTSRRRKLCEIRREHEDTEKVSVLGGGKFSQRASISPCTVTLVTIVFILSLR